MIIRLEMSALSVSIIYNKTNTFGLQDDVAILERVLRKLQDSIGQPISKAKLVDMREPMSHCDILIHLEVPVFSAIPLAHTNMILVNPEQWSYAYDAYVHAFDVLLFRDNMSAIRFREDFEEKGIHCNDKIHVVPWCAEHTQMSQKGANDVKDKNDGFVCFIGGSTSKYEYVAKLLPYWSTASDPPLTIYTVRADFAEGLKKVAAVSGITVICQDLDKEMRARIMTSYNGHLVCSRGEAFGYAAANAEAVGAFTIMNALPAFEYTYLPSAGISYGISWLSNQYQLSDTVRYDMASPSATVREELDAAFQAFRSASFMDIKKVRMERSALRFSELCDAFRPVLLSLQKNVKERRPSKGVFHCPPILNVADCPPISIVTPTYNRVDMIDIAFHNLLATDYPHDKIEWIIVEDNERKSKMASEKIVSFQIQVPHITLKYIPIEGRMTIGEKRNLGVENATNDIILFMDDDDHYTSTSFRRRVAWLTKGVKCGSTAKIVCCTTLPLYDLKHGTSAVNVPPYDIPFSQRISEATLTFYKSVWVERKFPLVSVSEGESWIHGREDQVLEISPQQIIVAFTHGSNQSSRKIPADTKPSCFWGFPKEYLIFIHKLAGVEVEEERAKKK